jgi:hypothetical protein
MSRKIHILVLLFVLVLAGAGFAAWYVYKQSTRLKVISQPESSVQEKADKKPQDGSPAGAAANASAALGEAAGNASLMSDQGNASSPEQSISIQQEEEASSAEQSFASWVKDYVVTPYFIQDLATFVTSSYYPPRSKNNPTEHAKNTLNFKSLNARYGLELIGLRHKSDTLREAREEILGYFTDSEVLRKVYDQYADTFLQELVATARQTERSFQREDGSWYTRTLQPKEISRMLVLNSAYLKDVAAVFQALAQGENIASQVERYLQAAQEVVHYNFKLNQIQNRVALLQKERAENASSEEASAAELEEMQQQKEAVGQRYKQAISKREHLRKELMQSISSQTGEKETLQSHEVLYIAEWVHRRLAEGENNPAILTTSELLEDMAVKMDRKADRLAAGSGATNEEGTSS